LGGTNLIDLMKLQMEAPKRFIGLNSLGGRALRTQACGSRRTRFNLSDTTSLTRFS
jgi:CO/xanthine dehydrogenase FAD-binding subunit